jgi:hypothetical protein
MKSKCVYILFLTCVLSLGANAQGKKDVKKNKIKSITEIVTTTENGKEITYKAYYIAFNKDGEVTEETEYYSNGTIKKKETTKYDANDNKVEETFYQKKNPKSDDESEALINQKIVYKYNVHNDKVEEDEIDASTGKIIKMQLFLYNSKGERNIEETYDANKKLIKKALFTYDSKGLKTEKKVYNANNVLEMTKKYVYEF